MTSSLLEDYFKASEEDYAKVISEGDVAMQDLKTKCHELKIQAYCNKKERDIDKLEVQRLKKSLDFIKRHKYEIC